MNRQWLTCALVGSWFAAPPVLAQTGRESVSDRITSGRPAAAESVDFADVARRVVTRTNEFRTGEGRSAVKANDTLTKTAKDFAAYLARTDKFSHTADGREPWDRAAAHGYDYCIVLENIAWEFNSEGFTAPALARAFVTGWKNSPGHRKNMLDRDVTETGVGVAHSAETGRYYAVQMFGRPKSAAIEFEVMNATDAPVQFTLDGKETTIRPSYTVTYTRCRPPEVRFDAIEKDRVFRPQNGTHYVIRAEGGKDRIEEK